MSPCILCGFQGSPYVEPDSIQACSCRACAQVGQLEKDIEEARKHLESLIKKLPQARYFQNAEHDYLVKRLPRELISRIFQFCLVVRDEDTISIENYTWYTDKQHANSPYGIVQVSQMWRSIALSTPQLWTHISFFLRRGNPLHGSRSGEYMDFIKEYLSRSGTLPMDLVIRADWLKLPYGPILELLNGQSHRWRAIFLYLPSEDIQQLVGNEETSILYSLHINNTDIVSDFLHKRLFQFPKATPKKVRLEGSSQDLVCINWASVTHLTLGYFTPDGIFDLFRGTPQLEYFKAESLFEFSDEQVAHPPVIILPNLHTLILEELHFIVDILFKPLHLPALSSISLSTFQYRKSLVSWIEQWSCTIHHLSLENPPEYLGEAIINLLEVCPSLRTLTMKYAIGITKSILERLSDSLNPFLPDLQTFHFTEDSASTVEWSFIPLLFAARKQQVEVFNDNGNDFGFIPDQSPSLIRHNLHLIIIYTTIAIQGSDYLEWTEELGYIPQRFLGELLDLKERGFKIDIRHEDHPEQDFLLISADHYGMGHV